MTTTARTAPKFCANIRAERPEMFVLDLNYYGISGNIEPWPECQPEASQPASQMGVRKRYAKGTQKVRKRYAKLGEGYAKGTPNLVNGT